MTQATCLDATHFDSKARHWNDNPVFRERGLKIAEAIRKSVPLNRHMAPSITAAARACFRFR